MADVWNEVLAAIRADFADLPSIAEVTRVMVRLTLAAFLGGLLGYERGQVGKKAGVRTHMLVALGSAFFVLIPAQAGITGGELSRVLQGVITGVGFLGTGTILKGSHEGQVHGLTTAAGIWFTAAVGIATGLGREASALLGTILALLILTVIPHVAPTQSSDEDRPGEEE